MFVDKTIVQCRFQELEWDHWNGLVRHDNARKSVKEMLALIIGKDACSITSDENVHYKPGKFSHLDGKLLYLSQSLAHTQ